MSASNEPLAFEQQAPFPGHPFGGLVREDLSGLVDRVAPPGGADADASPAPDDAGGFDFHLGVYSRF